MSVIAYACLFGESLYWFFDQGGRRKVCECRSMNMMRRITFGREGDCINGFVTIFNLLPLPCTSVPLWKAPIPRGDV